ncbi:MAG: hypothetical protein EOP06_04895 [Proteobacteria bacterium]|nr:MAG: hypothetical protein EOP06_04895 [Pseudomonadota bacterium]
MKKSLLLLILLFGFAPDAFAHPVSYKDAIGVMTWNQAFMSDQWVTYSFKPNMAVAARFMRMEMPESRLNYSGAQFDYLLARDNGDDHQVNLYAYAGGGNVHFDHSDGGAYFAGFEADAENRKYFGLFKAETMRSSNAPDFDHLEARLGVAPYEAEYTEIATWFMIQAQWHPTLSKKFVLTPLARLFYKSFLLETGVSVDGDWMMNFMFHF